MTKHIDPPLPQAISIEFETYAAARSRFTAEVEGATTIDIAEVFEPDE